VAFKKQNNRDGQQQQQEREREWNGWGECVGGEEKSEA